MKIVMTSFSVETEENAVISYVCEVVAKERFASD